MQYLIRTNIFQAGHHPCVRAQGRNKSPLEPLSIEMCPKFLVVCPELKAQSHRWFLKRLSCPSSPASWEELKWAESGAAPAWKNPLPNAAEVKACPDSPTDSWRTGGTRGSAPAARPPLNSRWAGAVLGFSGRRLLLEGAIYTPNCS